MSDVGDRWLRISRPNPEAPARLFCFPWAGGASSAFHRWAAALPAVEVCVVQLPGREDRLRETPLTSIDTAAAAVTPSVERLSDRPFAFFGHSAGALLAFAVARTLADRGARLPARLFASGSHPPDEAAPRPRHQLPDQEFLREVYALGGTSSAVLDQPDLQALFLPLLRADFQMAETYRAAPGPRLDVPITVLGGRRDREVGEASLDGWARHTTRTLDVHLFDGGHFFVQSAQSAVLSLIEAEMRTL